MSKEYKMRQCHLSKKTENGRQIQVAWIPEKFAVAGNYLKLHEENGWLVDSVGDKAVSSSIINERSQDHKSTRKASDI